MHMKYLMKWRELGKKLKIGDDKKVQVLGQLMLPLGLKKFGKNGPLLVYVTKINPEILKVFIWTGLERVWKRFSILNQLYDCHPNAVIGRGKVGKADAKLTSMGATLQIELEALRDDPDKFLRCGNARCVSCKLSWEHHNDNFWDVIKSSIGRFKFRDVCVLCGLVF